MLLVSGANPASVGRSPMNGCSPTPILRLAAPPRSQVSVRASTAVPGHCLAGPFLPSSPVGAHMSDIRRIQATLQVRHQGGRLELDTNTAPDWLTSKLASDWLLLIQPAFDRHEQNCEVVRDARGLVFLRTLRPLRQDEELFVWYSDEYGRESGIPVLTPENIRGNQEYACTRCPESFLHPNTLKAHIRFTCPRSSLEEKPRPSTLTPARPLELLRRPHISNIGQERKHAVLTSDRSSDSVDDSFSAASAFRPLSVKHESPVPVSPENRGKPVSSPTVSTSRNTMRQSRIPAVSTSTEQTLPIPAVAPSTLPFGQAYNPISLAMEHAALRYYYPFYGRVAPEGHMCTADQPQSALVPQSAAAPVFHPAFCYPYGIPKPALPSDKPGMTAPRPLRDSHDGRHPDGPTLMSLAFPLPSESEGEPLDLLPRSLYMSKSRKGHLCIYCGKLYSRKYGLKIHLRTHTGYKPLQCKVCLRPFGDPSNLNKHIRLHAEGDTPYRCEFCGKVLVRRRDLERHIKSRHPSESLSTSGEACAAGSGTTEASDCGSEPTDQDSGGGSSHDGSDSDSDEIEVVS